MIANRRFKGNTVRERPVAVVEGSVEKRHSTGPYHDPPTVRYRDGETKGGNNSISGLATG
jgi:hypothetical protein